MYATKFTVEGGGQFPLDMLRYDGAYPVSSSDVSAMTDRGRRRVSLATAHPTKGNNGLTPKRWQSFGWVVVSVEDAQAC